MVINLCSATMKKGDHFWPPLSFYPIIFLSKDKIIFSR